MQEIKKKIKKYIIPISLLVIAIVVTTTILIANAVTNAGVERDTRRPDFKISELNLDGEITAKRPSEFSSVNNAGKDYVKKAETEFLELYYAELPLLITDFDNDVLVVDEFSKKYDIAIYDKRTKKLWNALVDEKEYINANLSDEYVARYQSLVSFSYVDVISDKNRTEERTLMAVMPHVTTDDIWIENGEMQFGVNNNDAPQCGLRVNFNITLLSIEFSVDFKMSDDFLDVSVPDDKIVEQVNDVIDQVDEAKLKLQDVASRTQNLLGRIRNKFRKIADRVKEEDIDWEQEQTDEERIRIEESRHARMIDSQIATVLNRINGLAGNASEFALQEVVENVGELEELLKDDGDYTEQMQQVLANVDELKDFVEFFGYTSLCGVFRLDILPFLGSGTKDTDGYVFYPDGCGAISRFDRYRAAEAGGFSAGMYTNNTLDLSVYMGWSRWSDTDEHEETTPIKMPVFGVKQENSAFVCITAEGDTDANISYNPVMKSFLIGNIYGSFYFRNVTQETNPNGDLMNIIDPKKVQQARTQRYYFLTDDKADYSGMAVRYREYLENHELINKSPIYNQEYMPLDLDVVMGVLSSDNSVTEQYYPLTTYAQAKDIFSTLKDKGVKNINAVLNGWSDAGWYDKMPDYNNHPESSIGGVNGLKSVTSFAKENNMLISLTSNKVFGCVRSGMRHSDISGTTIKNYGEFTVSYYCDHMYNPFTVFNRNMDAVRKVEKYGVDAMQYYNEGQVVYRDYNRNAYVTRQESKDVMLELAKQTKEEIGHVFFGDPNIYVVKYADYIRNLPDESYNYLFTDEEVPFYQIVLHGLVPYSGLNFNSMHDIAYQSLKAIEFGNLPKYILTNDSPNIKTTWNALFSSEAQEWFDRIAEVYNKYETRLGGIWKQKMMRIEDVTDDIRCITYESGTKIYLNYSEKDQKYNGIEIKAMDFTVID